MALDQSDQLSGALNSALKYRLVTQVTQLSGSDLDPRGASSDYYLFIHFTFYSIKDEFFNVDNIQFLAAVEQVTSSPEFEILPRIKPEQRFFVVIIDQRVKNRKRGEE